MKPAVRKTLIGAAALATSALIAKIVIPGKTVQTVVTVQNSTLGFVDACASQGNIAEAVMTWRFSTPDGEMETTWAQGVCSGYVVPPNATAGDLTITYPGGYTGTAAFTIAFVTRTPTSPPTNTPTITTIPTITPTSPPELTPTPCRDSANPYGIRQRSPFNSAVWWCVNCNGQQVGVPNDHNACGPTNTPTQPTPTATTTREPTVRPAQVPTRRPPIVVPFRTPS